MSWVVDVSRCLGLMDVGSRDVGRRGAGPSGPLRRNTKSSGWLLGSPMCRGTSQPAPKKKLHRSGSRSTPCLNDSVPTGSRKPSDGDLAGGRESLVSTPATSSVDSLECEPALIPGTSTTAPGPGPGSAVVVTMAYNETPRASLTRSCEVLGMTETEDSSEENNLSGDTPARARSVSRLDCSVNYSDSPPLVPAGPHGSKDSPRGVFMEARDTLVTRLCAGGSRVPPLPDSEHPSRVFTARHRFARSEHSLSQPAPQRRISHHALLKGRERPGGVGGRSRSEHALIRPSWFVGQPPEQPLGSQWSIWAQDLLDSLHQMNAQANRTPSPTSTLASSTSTIASTASSRGGGRRAPRLAKCRGTGGSQEHQVSMGLP